MLNQGEERCTKFSVINSVLGTKCVSLMEFVEASVIQVANCARPSFPWEKGSPAECGRKAVLFSPRHPLARNRYNVFGGDLPGTRCLKVSTIELT